MCTKILGSKKLSGILNRLRSKGIKVVFTNGCFDILHVGHINYLSKARHTGGVLVVGLNSDPSVKKIKGKGRPINNERDRAKVLSALSCVDYICVFEEPTPLRLIKELKPDILVKGGDWKMEDIVGADYVKSRGGKVKNIPFIKGYSTTSLIKRIENA